MLTRIDAERIWERRTRPDPDCAVAPAQAVQLCCPYCHQAIEVVVTPLPPDLACPACGGTFSVEALSTASGRAMRPPAQRLGRYELGELLGTGAFGSVWRARDAELGREVALKLPRGGQVSSDAEQERFLREGRAAAHLHHPGIVAVHDVGRDQETLYMISELVRGVSLAEWLKGGWLSFPEAAELVAQVADALDYAHRRGVVHRDVKPSNIMLELDDAQAEVVPDMGGKGVPAGPPPIWGTRRPVGRPRIMDFGLALRDAGEVTMTLDGQVLGTPAYMSPEQVCNPHAVDRRSDVYSLGVILYELLTGELPFRGVTRMRLLQVLHEEPRPPQRLNDKVPRDLETICLKAMAKGPGRRYGTAGALAADLRRWRAGEPIQARPVGRPERLWLWAKRQPALAMTGGLAAAALVAISGAPAAASLVAITAGALLFALHKANAAAELAQAVEEAGQNLRKAAAALQFALKQCHLARRERDRAAAAEAQARRRFGQVRELARAFLFDFPDKIGHQPGSTPARAFLIQTALAYLDSLAASAGDDAPLLRELAVAYAQAGDLQADANQGDLRDPAGALASHRKSRDIFANLAKSHPDNAQAQRNLSASDRKVGDLQRALGQGGRGVARDHAAPTLGRGGAED